MLTLYGIILRHTSVKVPWMVQEAPSILSGKTIINTPKEFAEFANTVSTISRLYLLNEDLLEEPDHVKDCTPISNTIKAHKIVQSYTSKGVPCSKFFYLSNNEKPHFVQWYDFACSYYKNEVDDNTCCHCLKLQSKRRMVQVSQVLSRLYIQVLSRLYSIQVI